MCPALCEHHKPGTYVRPDLIPGYAEVGLTCVHGYMVDTVDRSNPVLSLLLLLAQSRWASPENEYAQSNSHLAGSYGGQSA
jgi:hypothetical protein